MLTQADHALYPGHLALLQGFEITGEYISLMRVYMYTMPLGLKPSLAPRPATFRLHKGKSQGLV